MYKLTEEGVKRLEDNAFIPADSKNKDWQKYQEWLSEGNTPEPQFTLDELKTNKRLEIKAAYRQSVEDASMYSDAIGAEVDVGDRHFLNIDRLIDQLTRQGESSVQFRTHDNSFVEITLDQVKALKEELTDFKIQMLQKKWDLENQIETVTSEEQLDTINW